MNYEKIIEKHCSETSSCRIFLPKKLENLFSNVLFLNHFRKHEISYTKSWFRGYEYVSILKIIENYEIPAIIVLNSGEDTFLYFNNEYIKYELFENALNNLIDILDSENYKKLLNIINIMSFT